MDMKQNHRNIKERLPDYVSDTLSGHEKGEFERHIAECADCQTEMELIRGLIKIEAPDPGEMFWKTLPKKATALVKEDVKSTFTMKNPFKPLALTALVCLIAIAAITIIYSPELDERYYDPLFRDPLSSFTHDYSFIAGEDLTEISEGISAGINDMDIFTETYFGNSYHEELASLSAEEAINLYEELASQEKNGGVI
jgi:hypothetical protein